MNFLSITLCSFLLILTVSTVHANPPNDHFRNVIPLTGASGQITATNVGATRESGERTHAGSTGGASVWWSWTAPSRGSVIFYTAGSNFDTILAVYRGNALSSLTEMGSNDDESDSSLTSAVSFTAFQNVVYYIVVDGYDGDSGNIVLSWSSELPSNDNFADRISLAGESGQLTMSNANASRESGEPNHANYTASHSLWWSWTAPRSGYATIDTYQSALDTVLAVYHGASLGSLQLITACDDFDALYTIFSKNKTGFSAKYIPQNAAFRNRDLTSTVNFYTEAGREYQIAVDGAGNAIGEIVLSWHLEDPPASAPPNDHFDNRIAIDGGTGQITGANIFATKQGGEPPHADNLGGRSVWWSWTAPTTGIVTFDTVGSGYDTTISVYKGNSVDTLSLLIGNDDIGIPVASRVTFTATKGNIYHIAVDGYDGDFGTIVLNWTNEIPPNDNFADRILLNGESGRAQGTNINAGRESGEPTITDANEIHSVWWSWTAARSGNVTVDTIGSDFDSILAVYTGMSLQSLVRIVSNGDTNDRRVTFNAEQGQTYHFLVGGKKDDDVDTADAGRIVLNWNSASPANDNFADRITLTGVAGQTSGSNVSASRETNEPDHAGVKGAHSVWWSWTAPFDAKISFNTHGSRFDTCIAVYQGDAVESLVLIRSNDDDAANGGVTSAVTFSSREGQSYAIAVDGYSGDAGDITLKWQLATPTIRIEPLTLAFSKLPLASAKQISTIAQDERIVNQSTSAKSTSRQIHVKTGTIQTGESNSPPSQITTLATDMLQPQHMLLQFDHIPSAEEKQSLAANGVELLRYMPDNAYWASIHPKTSTIFSTLSKNSGIRWSKSSRAIDKLDPDAAAGKFPPNTRLRNGTVEIWAVVFDDVDEAIAREQFAQLNCRILDRISTNVYRLAAPIASIRDVSALDIVEWVEAGPPPKKQTNATAALRLHNTEVYEPPYALTGAGVVVGIWDGGEVDHHRDFDSRLVIEDAGSKAEDHATHVAGIIGGSGRYNPNAKGMAPGVEIHSYDWDEDINKMRQASTLGVRLTNHSYDYSAGWEEQTDGWRNLGDYLFGNYNTYGYAWDAMVWDTGLLTFRAASNDRDQGPDWPYGPRMDGPYRTILPGGSNKNGVTIGALADHDRMTDFSSWGPTADGRIKPDLCANGYELTSTVLDNGYDSFSGTSMASPAACGSAALLFELYQSVTAEEPKAETLKALLIHGARDLGNPGPDYAFGWGMIDTRESADLIFNRMWDAGTISYRNRITYSITIPPNHPYVKATLVWTDAPGSPAAAKALVNDLDLQLRSPSGAIFYPWVLDKDNPSANATSGVNTIDNVEQVYIENPESGEWTIEVIGSAITQDEGRFALVSEMLRTPDSTNAFWIYNDGEEPLTVNKIIAVDGVMEAIAISPNSPFEIAPNSYRKVNVTVDFTRISKELNATQLYISSNDPAPNKNPYPDGVILHFNPTEVEVNNWTMY
jgi:hypothetical protein